jgi:2-methylcitrate dehydratase PrpD
LHEKGWHPTTVRGTLAAAAAAARLRRLDVAQLTNALAIAASMAGGLVANFGTQTKAFQVGRAAQAGVTAASLAAAGMTAASDALEHAAGFLAAFSPNRNPDTGSRPLRREGEQDWHIVRGGLNVKRYPMCYAVHRAVDATLALTGPNQLRPEDIAEVRVFTGDVQMVMLRNARPQTSLEAKFSMPFAIASAVIAGNVGLEQLNDAFVTSRDVQSFFAKVICETTTDRLEGSAFAPFDRVEIRTTGGVTLRSNAVSDAKGSYRNPLSRDEFWIKFADCLGNKIPRANQEPLFDLFLNLERAAGVAEIVSLAVGTATPRQ